MVGGDRLYGCESCGHSVPFFPLVSCLSLFLSAIACADADCTLLLRIHIRTCVAYRPPFSSVTHSASRRVASPCVSCREVQLQLRRAYSSYIASRGSILDTSSSRRRSFVLPISRETGLTSSVPNGGWRNIQIYTVVKKHLSFCVHFFFFSYIISHRLIHARILL